MMYLVLGIAAGIIILVALVVWNRKRRAIKLNNQSLANQLRKKAGAASDTQAFQKWAEGRIGRDTYVGILDKNEKEGR